MARWWGAGLFLFIFVIGRLWLSMTFPTFSDTLQNRGGVWRLLTLIKAGENIWPGAERGP
jgi:hypothetical protein